jgi:hypothetical protein
MRLPLLVEGNINKLVQCASVRLPLGKWRIIFENHKDSVLSLTHGQIVQGGSLQVCVIKKGSETNLSIFAEKIQ